jgi:serine/threonine protein kinase
MAADIYAFACLAYEVLTGDTLFEAPGELATINLHLSHDGYPEKLLQMRAHPRLTALCDLLANALRQHPEERISMGELREGLAELAGTLDGLEWPLRAA